MAFASATELAAYLQREPFTGAEVAAAELVLDIATSVVVERTGQQFIAVEGDEVTLDGNGGEDLHLPQRPVTAVTSITTRERGTTATMARVLNTDYEVRGSRLRWVGIGRWPYEVTVTYSHGYATIPDDVKGATLAVAAEIFTNPEALSRSALDDSNDQHEWADDSPAERMLQLVERRYGRKHLSVRMARR